MQTPTAELADRSLSVGRRRRRPGSPMPGAGPPRGVNPQMKKDPNRPVPPVPWMVRTKKEPPRRAAKGGVEQTSPRNRNAGATRQAPVPACAITCPGPAGVREIAQMPSASPGLAGPRSCKIRPETRPQLCDTAPSETWSEIGGTPRGLCCAAQRGGPGWTLLPQTPTARIAGSKRVLICVVACRK
jgi:hypothetical protein